MRITEMDTLYAYNWSVTARVLDSASGISHHEFVRAGVVPIPFGGLRGILAHMLEPASFTSIEEITRSWKPEPATMNDYLTDLMDENKDSEYALNETERYPYWQLLVHLITHSTQHRREATILLTALDRSPGDLDLSLSLRESLS